MKRTSLLRAAGASALGIAAGGFPTYIRAAGATNVLIAEPQHNTGYMPLYVAIDQGLFKGLDVSLITLAQTGSAHSDAVLTGRAWGFVGGPEHNAFADLRGADIRAIAEIGARGNQYFVSKKNPAPGQDMKSFWKGKTIVTGPLASSPNNITRFVLAKLGLDPKNDVTLLEVDNNSIPVVLSQGRADIAGVREPLLSRGIIGGQWLEPFYNVPKMLGPYTFSAINTTYKNIQDTATSQAFVNGIRAAGDLIKKDPSVARRVTKKEFPDLSDAIIDMAVKRSFDDHLWSETGIITPQSFQIAVDAVIAGGSMPPGQKITYQMCVDMRFVARRAVRA
jgi:NitT/TauT family transport system substrate-binding protein